MAFRNLLFTPDGYAQKHRHLPFQATATILTLGNLKAKWHIRPTRLIREGNYYDIENRIHTLINSE